MTKGRVEAFSDAVIAIIITIMVLELKVPHEPTLEGLLPLIPVFVSYVLSFIYIGIYWNNHHHMFHAVHHVNGGVLWANLNLMFWLSLIPFTTNWLGEHPIEALPNAVYGFNLMLCGFSYTILARVLMRLEGHDSALAHAFGRDRKGWISVAIYLVAIVFAFVSPWVSRACFFAVALLWLVPDRRIERVMVPKSEAPAGH